MQVKTDVGLVGAEGVDGIAVGEAWEGAGGEALGGVLVHEGDHEAFDDGEDIFLGDEGHFEIELVELAGAAVGAGVLITEAGGDLVIAVKTGDHEELFKLLGGLGEGVEAAGMEAAGDEEIACAFWGAVGEEGGLELVEAFGLEVSAHGGDNLGAEDDVALHFFAAEVEEAEAQAEVFVDGGGVVDREGECFGAGEDGQLGDMEFDGAGSEFGIDGIWGALNDRAGDGENTFVTEVGGGVEELGLIWVKDDLGDAVMIAEINEDDAAVIAAVMDPAGETDGLAGVSGAEFTAGMSAIAMHIFVPGGAGRMVRLRQEIIRICGDGVKAGAGVRGGQACERC